MSSSIRDILNIARSGLNAHQTALRVTGHNVANVNTPGYSRQRVDMVSLGPGNNMPGIGVSAARINRAHDAFLTRQVQMQNGRYSFLTGQQMVAQSMEYIFPELDSEGINSSLSHFFNSARALSNNPSGITEREQILYAADELAIKIRRAYESLESVRRGLNGDVADRVAETNGLLSEMASLNRKIAAVSDPSGEGGATDLLDRRDEVIRQLHGLIEIDSFEDADGHINVMFRNRVIVEGVRTGSLRITSDPVVGVELVSVSGVVVDITEGLANEGGRGELTGMIVERDVFIEDTKAKLDQLAYNLADKVNAIHRAAYGLDVADPPDFGTGRDFFEAIASVDGAALAFKVNQLLIDHPDMVAVSSDPNAVAGNNEAILAIADLQSDKTSMGNTSFTEFFSTAIGTISNRLMTLSDEIEYQQMVVDQAEAFRDSMSGVSIDEEMVQLVQHQRAFEASARMVSTMDELLQQILNLKQ